ncbi:MAG: esterase/lipase family protein [Rhizobiaceae bacterium]
MAEAATAAPGRRLLMMELRAIPELFGFAATLPSLTLISPKGDGQPVLVLPGFITTDKSTIALRTFLTAMGYPSYGWDLGRNFGPLPGMEDGLKERLEEIHQKHDRKVSIVGWSLGGIYARQLAKMMPDSVRQVITLGSPFTGNPKHTNAWKLYQMASGHKVDERDNHMGGAISEPPNVPTTAIYSKSDGICAWQNCIEESALQAENIEVKASHCGLGHHPAAVFAIADRLSQKENDWKPFDRSGFRAIAFPKAYGSE